MMSSKTKLSLYEAYGIELEYMIVDRDTLDVRPIADELLMKAAGRITNEIAHDMVSWSNELVLHVIELKCTPPTANLLALNQSFHENIEQVNRLLEPFNACLMPTAAHPWMDPYEETKIWPHDNSEIYDLYNQVFDCRGHGWSNLQSMHINLPFATDAEFAVLHEATRLVLPLLPGLSASSPILDGAATGALDRRLEYYQTNQARIPAIIGPIIPESVSGEADYQRVVYDPIAEGIKPFDTEGVLEPIWVNSRGAIARFDRGSIEIRVMDLQECPQADLALAALVIQSLRLFTDGHLDAHRQSTGLSSEDLREVFRAAVVKGQKVSVKHEGYLAALGWPDAVATVGELWQHLLEHTLAHYPDEMEPWETTLRTLLAKGTLAQRILRAVDGDFSREKLHAVYRQLQQCLTENRLFGV